MQATAKAHTNIALVKYWGKRDELLFLPMNSSLSVTLDGFYTVTSVIFDECLKEDEFILNGEKGLASDRLKVSTFLDNVRKLSKSSLRARVISQNSVPTAAGFASSASGFAALAAAAVRALGLALDEPALSRLARLGSGSACRSVYGGFVKWQKGVEPDGSDSFAQPVAAPNDWDLRILVAVVESNRKGVSSREGMRRTVLTSPYYAGWLATVENDLARMTRAIADRDFKALGELAEANALKMHAATLAAVPPFTYWRAATLDVLLRVQELRTDGILAYCTMDAGPNVKVLCQKHDAALVAQVLRNISGVEDVVDCGIGPGLRYLEEVAH